MMTRRFFAQVCATVVASITAPTDIFAREYPAGEIDKPERVEFSFSQTAFTRVGPRVDRLKFVRKIKNNELVSVSHKPYSYMTYMRENNA